MKTTNQGFTLLLTIIIIGVVLAVTLSSLNLSIKQVRLSVDTRDSEVAFHAANAGLECIRHWRRAAAGDFESDGAVEIECFGSSDTSDATAVPFSGDGEVYRYEYQLTWGGVGSGERCSQMRFMVISSDIDSEDGVTVPDMREHLVGYPSDSKACEPGGMCTVFSSQGYSASCPDTGLDGSFPLGTIQREILVEF